MGEIITLEETEESEIIQQIIKFPQLKYLILHHLEGLKSFYMGGSKLEFPKLENLKLSMLRRMNSFAQFENSSSLFHEKIDFPCLEELDVSSLSEDILGLWDSPLNEERGSVSLNPAPMLRKLTVGNTAGLRRIPSVILENLSSLTLVWLNNDVVFSSLDVQVEEGFVWTQLPKLEELRVVNSESVLKELFKVEDFNEADALKFCGQMKRLELDMLSDLNLTPLHLFKSLASLILNKLKWEYLISADLLGNSLRQLQYLSIKKCNNMEVLVTDVVSDIELPQLKELVLEDLYNLTSFSATSLVTVTLRLPSLESLTICSCGLQRFWSGPIAAPRLQVVDLSHCREIQQLFNTNPDQVTELMSLQQVIIISCSNIGSFSSGPLHAPKLRGIELRFCDSMMCFTLGNRNQDGDIQLPYLETLEICGSPSLYSFSLTPIVAPKLKHVEYDGRVYSMLEYDDLNHFLKGSRFM